MELCKTAQQEFGLYTEMNIIPFGQLYAGKICAALDRQHPRDLFDIKYLLIKDGIDDNLKYSFIFYSLSSSRPLHELLNPTRIDQKKTLEEHFTGMTRDSFTYKDYEEARETLINKINSILTHDDKKFLLSFINAEPDWSIDSFLPFRNYPSIKWKLENLVNLKKRNPEKHQKQIRLLNQQFDWH